MTATLMPLVKQQFNQNGVPLTGGKLFVYSAGTTTKATTFTDSTGAVPNTNPIILDANGQASVWLDPTKYYKFILSPSTDTDPPTNPYWTVDNVAAPAPVAVGNMTDEKGSDGNPGFKAGTDFTAGTTTTLTLSQSYGSASNIWVAFDAAEQGADSFTLNGTTLTFSSAIPVGTNKVYVKGGTSLSLGTPAAGSVTDSSIASGSNIYNVANAVANVLSYGAKGDGVTDCTNAFRTAVATGKNVYVPAGNYLLKDSVTLSTQGQKIFGDGRYLSSIKINTSFNLSSIGVFISNAIGIEYADLGISFTQPDTNLLSGMTQYPAAISGIGQPGQCIRRCFIFAAWNAVDWRDNCGQSIVEDLTYSHFNIGIWLDGSTDSIQLDGLHCWPANLTANQIQVMGGSQAIGVNSGRCDDLKISNSLFYVGTALNLFTGSRTNAGTTFGEVTTTDFDTYNGIFISAGQLSVSACFFSIGIATAQCISQTGGFLKLSSCEFEAAVQTANPMVQMTGAGSGFMKLAACMFRTTGDMQVTSVSSTGNTNTMTIVGCDFQAASSTTPVNALINQNTNGRLTAIGNRVTDKGSGSGNFIAISTDDHHVVTENSCIGWSISIPSSIATALVFNNTGQPSDFSSSGYLTGEVKVKRFVGNLDGSGNMTVAHGLGGANQKVLLAQAFYRGLSGQMSPLAFGYIDGTNFNATGGTAGVAYRGTIFYTETQQGW